MQEHDRFQQMYQYPKFLKFSTLNKDGSEFHKFRYKEHDQATSCRQ